MRADMGKVLVERPRLGRWRGDSRPGKGREKRLKKCLDAGDSPPAREGIKRRAGNTKSFNEHLGPLRRFLCSNVGRPWNKIYSEICQHVDRGNIVQKHILTHLFQYVVTNVILVDGKPCRGEGYRYGESLLTHPYRNQWYVCPKSGLLRVSRYAPQKRRVEPPTRTVKLNNRQLCVSRNGHWELITVAMVAQPRVWEPPAYDTILEQYAKGEPVKAESDLFIRGNRYQIRRQRLSRKDLLALPIPIDWLW